MSRSTRLGATCCVVGSGGREHALARVLARTCRVIVAPGTHGIAGGHIENPIELSVAPPEEIGADLFVIGPEAPLVDGLADRLRARGKRVVGPGADGARLEGSKAFMKEVLERAGVPTARFGTFSDFDAARRFLRTLDGPYVVKTDGLASGKGVLVAETLEEAEADVSAKLSGVSFGEAGRRVVIEEGLSGVECSLLALCDGARVQALPLAQDFKRLGDGDEGPNTGGMGSFSPLPWAKPDMADQIIERAVEPLVAELRRRGIEYRGVLYAGVMVGESGPQILEYNVRFGDPEAQVVWPRLASDPFELLLAVAEGALTPDIADRIAISPDAAVCVVMAGPGYPQFPAVGGRIEGLGQDGQLAHPIPGVTLYHSGTSFAPSPGGGWFVNGGRVLGVTAMGDGVEAARARSYQAAARISFDGAHYRRDIAGEVSRPEASTPLASSGGGSAPEGSREGSAHQGVRASTGGAR